MRSLRCAIVLAALAVAGAIVWFALPHVPDFVSRRYAEVNGRKVQMLVVELPESFWSYEIVEDSANPKTVAAWREELGAQMVFNAAYFNEDFTPVGYLNEDKGESVIPWPTAEEQADTHGYTFMVRPHNGGIRLAYLPNDMQDEPLTSTLLSFPTLVVDGEPIVEENSFRYADRTMLAEDANGQTYLIITEKGDLTLYEAAQWLAQQPEKFVLAGNLDGGPSTGFSLDVNGFTLEVESALVPSVIVGRYSGK